MIQRLTFGYEVWLLSDKGTVWLPSRDLGLTVVVDFLNKYR